jgi:hypothetical protein
MATTPQALSQTTIFRCQWTGWSVFGVQIRYRADDFGPDTHATATSPNAAITTLTSPADTNNNNTALSNGAKIGIWIGLPIFVIIIGTMITFILIRGRGRQARHWSLSDYYDEYKAELPGNKSGISGGQKYAGKAELDSTRQPAELDSTGQLVELDISVRHAELEDTSPERSIFDSHYVGIRHSAAKRISST